MTVEPETIRELLKKGNPQEALKLAKVLISQNPLSAQGWVFVGDALHDLGRPYESWQAYRRGWLLDPAASWVDAARAELTNYPPTAGVDDWLQKALEVEKVSIAAAMIVRDEERGIARCISSLKEAVDEIVVVDTGSTDNTASIAKELGAEVYHFQWSDNFAEARNFALAQVKSKWVLWIDADEWLDPDHIDAPRVVAGLFDRLKQPIALLVAQVNQLPGQVVVNHDMSRIHPVGHGIEWRGRIHEQLIHRDSVSHSPGRLPRIAVNVRLLHDGYNPEVIAREEKLERNLRLLRMSVQDDPDDIASWGFLGRELLSLSRIEEAIAALRHAEGLFDRCPWYRRLPEVRSNLIGALLIQEELEEARTVALRGTEENPEFPGHWFDLAKIDLALLDRHLQSARRGFTEAEHTAQTYRGLVSFDAEIARWRAKAGLGDVAKLSGDLVTARNIYQQLAGLQPRIEAVHRLLTTIEQQRVGLNQLPR